MRQSFSPMVDFQRSKVYALDNVVVASVVPQKIQSEEFLNTLKDWIWTQLRLELPPKLRVASEANKGKSTGWRHEIVLSQSHANEHIMLHELAHCFNDLYGEDMNDGHGPNYVARYMFLLNFFYKVDENMLMAKMNDHKVKVNLGLYYKLKQIYV